MPKNRYLAGVSAFASLSCLSPAVQAQSQTQTPLAEEHSGIEDIVVTARRREENLQDVPVAVSVFTPAQLESRNAVQLSDLSRFTPGLALRPGPATPTVLLLTLRGQVQTDTLATVEPSVGAYVDEMYWARAYGLNGGMVDLANVQILKGPQGTLFGRNTTGGAILLTSNDPSTDEFSGKASATYGRYNEAVGEVVLNLPASERIAFRGAFRMSKRDGWGYGIRQFNTATGLPDNSLLPANLSEIRKTRDRFNDKDELQGRLKTLIEISDTTKLVMSGEWFNYKSHSPGRQLSYKIQLNNSVRDNVAFRSALNAYVAFQDAHPNAVGSDAFRCDYAVTQPASNCTDILRTSESTFTKTTTETYVAKLTSDIGIGVFKLIGGYRKINNLTTTDLDGSPTIMGVTVLTEGLRQWSAEGQLAGSLFSDRLDYSVGTTYFTESGYDLSYSLAAAPAGDRRADAIRFDGQIDNKSWGVYGQFSYHITDSLTFTGGLRYSHDKKGLELHNANVSLAGVPVGLVAGPYVPNTFTDPCNAGGAGTITGATPANNCLAQKGATFSATSWTAGLDYKITSDVLTYIKAGRGYRSGGFNLRALNNAQFQPFFPEFVDEQELGLKADFADHRVRLNVAVYHNEISDAQRNVVAPVGLTAAIIISNAAKVRNYGGEAELTVKPIDGLTFNASGSFNKAKYLQYADAFGDRSAERFQFLPKYQFSLSGQYETQLSSAIGVKFDVDYSWMGKFNTAPCVVSRFANDPLGCTFGILGLNGTGLSATDANGLTVQQIDAALVAASTIPSGGELGARMTFAFQDGQYTLSFWGRNLNNNRSFINSAIILAPQRNYVSAFRRPPAMYGLTAGIRF